jgi:hypothetical protein
VTRNRLNAPHFRPQTDPGYPTQPVTEARACTEHDGIGDGEPCRLHAGHPAPCLAAAAHLAFGDRATVITLPNAAAERKIRQRTALLYSASVLDAFHLHEAAALMRARAAAIQCGFTAVPPGIPPTCGHAFHGPPEAAAIRSYVQRELDKTILDTNIDLPAIQVATGFEGRCDDCGNDVRPHELFHSWTGDFDGPAVVTHVDCPIEAKS